MSKKETIIMTQDDAFERAVLVALEVPGRSDLDVRSSLDELKQLVETAGAVVMDEQIQKKDHPDPAYFIGKGKVNELKAICEQYDCDLVVFDHELAPTQRRNLETALEVKVVDRTEVILDIFASRAKSHEGKLQVELAQLSYMLPRLRGSGSELSRLGGGIGTRGPGETKLEVDRRRIRQRISELKRNISELKKNRAVQRQQRKNSEKKIVSLCGYTNAGKSSIMNLLTKISDIGVDRFVTMDVVERKDALSKQPGAGVLVEDKLFATLDPTVRNISLPSNHDMILSDTVGFIQRIPHDIIAAFRSTLEEISESDLILHVIDASDDRMPDQMAEVARTLEEVGAGDIPRLRVYNKIDLVDENDRSRLSRDDESVLISALTGEDVEALMKKVTEFISSEYKLCTFLIPYSDSGIENLIRERADVLQVEYRDDGIFIKADVPQDISRRYSRYIATGDESVPVK